MPIRIYPHSAPFGPFRSHVHGIPVQGAQEDVRLSERGLF